MKPLVLVIMDGWGLAPEGKGNAISIAKTPNFDFLMKNYPSAEIGAGGESIHLYDGHQGSSEMGHLIIGAGRTDILPQQRVYTAVKSGEVSSNPAYLGAIEHAKKNNSTLHLMGLLSDKGVHSYDILCHAIIEMAAKQGVKDLVVHVFTDGRDTEPHDAKKHIEKLLEVMEKNRLGKIGSVTGRYWIMDRDHRWERVEKGYNAVVNAKAEFSARNAIEAVENAYKRGKDAAEKGKTFIESDEFIKPTIIADENGEGVGKVNDGDAVVLCNFRTDRAIEITQAFVEKNFGGFTRERKPNVHFVCTSRYYDDLKVPVAFEKAVPENTLGEILSRKNIAQLRVAETEKWIYLTTIFNGLRENAFKGEERIMIPSDKIATYDLKPEMKAREIAEAVVSGVESGKYGAIFANFANPDILGHTGSIDAVVAGVEAVDRGVGMVVESVKKAGGVAVITADHGDAEEMLTKDGNPHTHHTANKVPFIVVSEDRKIREIKLRDGILEDIAPTILELLGIEKPEEMTGKSLILR